MRKKSNKVNLQKGAIQTFLIVVGLLIAMYFIATYLSEFVEEQTGLEDEEKNTDIVREIDFETINQGAYSDYEEEGAVLVENDTDYQTLVNQVSGARFPVIDFSEESVVAVFMGLKPTGGYSIKVSKIKVDSERVLVYVEKVTPGRNCVVTQSMVTPYHIVKFTSESLPIEFESSDVVEDC